MKLITKYDITSAMWLTGYYVNTKFIVLSKVAA